MDLSHGLCVPRKIAETYKSASVHKIGENVDICPRCGLLGTISIERKAGNRRCIYFVHYINKRRFKHYVGLFDEYVYVEKMHELNLRNIMDVNYFEVVERVITRYIDSYLKRAGDQKAARRKLLAHLQRIIEFCEKKIRELSLKSAEHSTPQQ